MVSGAVPRWESTCPVSPPWEPRAPSLTFCAPAGGDQEQEQQRGPKEPRGAGGGGGHGAGHGAQLGGAGLRCLEHESWRESWRRGLCGSWRGANPFYPWPGWKAGSPGSGKFPDLPDVPGSRRRSSPAPGGSRGPDPPVPLCRARRVTRDYSISTQIPKRAVNESLPYTSYRLWGVGETLGAQ